MKEILHTTVQIGLPKPVKVLQITDVHITEAYDWENEKIKDLTERRRQCFLNLGATPDVSPQENLKKAFALAEQEGAFPILTGDIIDFDTAANRDRMAEILKGKDYLYTAGTHEFQTTNWLDPMDEEGDYYGNIRKDFASRFGSWDFDHRIIGGVNLITMDNSQDFFEEDSYLKLLGEIERGYPIVLFSHIPQTCETLERTPEQCKFRFSQKQFEISRKCIQLIETCPLIKASFGGHWHVNREYPDHQPPTYCTPGAFAGVVRLIEIT